MRRGSRTPDLYRDGVAASSLRIVRRPKAGSARAALTAASQVIDDPSTAFKTPIATAGSQRGWQTEAWELLCVGELRYYVSWRSNTCGRVELIASEIGDDGLPTGGISEDDPQGKRVQEMVAAIAAGRLGQIQLVKRSVEHLTVPGETWIVILQLPSGPKNGDGTLIGTWLAVSRDEIKRGATGGVTIDLPDGTKYDFNTSTDKMFRIWNPDPRKASAADSPVRGCLDPLREIVRTTRKIRNADNSRLIGNGILGIPSEASLPPVQAPVSAGKPGDPPPEPEPQQVPVSQQVQKMIVDVAVEAMKNEDSMAGLVPIVVAAPGEHLQKITHVKFDDEVTQVAIQTRNDAIARLAMGLDVSPERLLGLGNNSNHWTAWAVGDEDVQIHIAPVMQTICQAITAAVLADMMRAEGIDPNKYTLWYDASKLTVDPDKTEEAQNAWEGGTIKAEAYLKYQGLAVDDGYDLTSLDGWQLWAQDQVSRNPELIVTLAPLITQVKGINFPTPPAIDNQPHGDPPVEEPAPQSEPNTEGDSPDGGARIGERSHVELAIDMCVSRALELAGKRRRNTHDPLQMERLRGIRAQDTHRVMGPVEPAQIGKLIKGWDDGLDELLGRYHLDADQIRSAVKRYVQRELTRDVIDVEAI